MIVAQDFTLDSENDLLIEDGDFVLSYSDGMHMEHIIQAFPGYYRRSILVGVGINQYLNSNVSQNEAKRVIRIALEADGYTVNTLDISSDWRVSIDAVRIK